MESSITTAALAVETLKQLARRISKSMLCLRIKVPKKTVHSFLELFQAEQVGWLPSRAQLAGQADWQVVGAGAAVNLSAEGSSRFETVQHRAQELYSQIEISSNATDSHFPELRFFGGGAFVPTPQQESIWSEFDDARFVIPRWQYATQSHDATLQLVIAADEFDQGDLWQKELRRIFDWLNQEDTLEMPATQSVNITHYSNGWEMLVHDALNNIAAGALHKVVVSRMSHLVSNIPFSLRRCLERLENSYADCIRFVFGSNNAVFIGATPEQLIRVSNHGHRFAADALAGSAQRTSSSDTAAMALQNSEKERREFEFVLSNIESQFIDSGIRITSDREIKVKSLKNLHHLHCPVSGVSDSAKHALELVNRLHPTPAVCGTPTLDAALWLSQNEHQYRGWYAGPIGWFDRHGDGDFAVGIRSALIKQNEAWLFAGAGIVEGSSAAVEFTETGAKLMPMLSALGAL